MIALAELYADPDVDPRLRQQAHTLLKRGGCQQCAERELAELWLVDVKQRYDQPCPDSASVQKLLAGLKALAEGMGFEPTIALYEL